MLVVNIARSDNPRSTGTITKFGELVIALEASA